MITIQDIRSALESVVAPYDVRAAYLFGSFARGDANAMSDVDVRLECGDNVDYAILLDIQAQLQSLLGRSIELITNPLEFMRPAFRERLQKDEVLLYEAA